MYISYLSTQPMLIDITIIVANIFRGKSEFSFHYAKYLHPFKGLEQYDIQVKYTILWSWPRSRRGEG